MTFKFQFLSNFLNNLQRSVKNINFKREISRDDLGNFTSSENQFDSNDIMYYMIILLA